MTALSHIGVLTVGNVLTGDDGIAPYTLKILESRSEFPGNVCLGTPGLGITSFFADCDSTMRIDAVSANGEPGQVHLFQRDLPPCVSPDDPALVEALVFAELSGKCPSHVLLVRVVPEAIELDCKVSEKARAATEPTISAILSELDRLGVHPHPRQRVLPPSIWWQDNVSSRNPSKEDHVPGHSR